VRHDSSTSRVSSGRWDQLTPSLAYLGEEQRTIPRDARLDPAHRGHEKVLGRGVNEIGGAPWEVHDARGNAGGISETTGTKPA
jgi:hypothetical protein